MSTICTHNDVSIFFGFEPPFLTKLRDIGMKIGLKTDEEINVLGHVQ